MRKGIEEAVDNAVAVIDVIPFASWPSQEVRGIACELIETLKDLTQAGTAMEAQIAAKAVSSERPIHRSGVGNHRGNVGFRRHRRGNPGDGAIVQAHGGIYSDRSRNRALGRLQGDDYARAKHAFARFGPEEMQNQWGYSGKTCAQILEEYRAHDGSVQRAIEEINGL